jgi:hypothetical protein
MPLRRLSDAPVVVPSSAQSTPDCSPDNVSPRRRLSTRRLALAGASAAAFGTAAVAAPAFASTRGSFCNQKLHITSSKQGVSRHHMRYVSGYNRNSGSVAIDAYDYGQGVWLPAGGALQGPAVRLSWSPGASGHAYGRAWNRGGGYNGGFSLIQAYQQWNGS